ncbi:class II fructose-bisphosphate aldolase [Paenibacillus naphthalenovorans]|uniref:class II fructose-bisphosphate aldolase n=1 Tax=Paenibacillus naphthalenovorans TaxID=162209 RepID=UPI0010B83DB0|nr:class II fructose-bisphosphate aldolase [Paenibacillus naphthalenovorans]GCL74285.1 fructose-1,6-bisphosphate aldolase, class II [Paenibacillus naphthalenovorans]
MLVPMKEILTHAVQNHYAVGSFDVPNLETATAVLEAAQENVSPVVIAVPETFFPFQQFEVFVKAIRLLAEPLDIPVALILDHGRSYDSCMRAIHAGMTTVMFDGSDLPYDENLAITKEIVKVAHSLGITVEAEVGHVARNGLTSEEISKLLTNPAQAAEFVNETQVDCLAVAVGTIHGKYKGEPKIHFDLLEQIQRATQIPLVLHGGSSTGEENLQRAISFGIRKINIYTDMAVAAKESVVSLLEQNDPKTRINDILIATKQSFGQVAGYYMRLFGSAGHAEGFPRTERKLIVK